MAKDITRDFTAMDLRALGLPSECKGGAVLEDRLLERIDEEKADKTNELRFVIFETADKEIWGIPYTKHESGRTSFDKTVMATRYTYARVLMQADAA